MGITENRTAERPGRARHSAAILGIILTSYLMIVLDASIVITGLPRIQHDLGFTPTGLSWVQSAYTLAFGGLLLLGARAGDILGRRRMFLAGLALFTVASLGVGFAPSVTVMLIARALQGVGSAIVAPTTLALLQTNFAEGPERTRAVAYYGAVAGIGASAGLVLGGLFAGWMSWRVGFFINVPIGIGLMAGAMRYIAETERHIGQFDLAGALSSTIGMTSLVYGIVRSASEGWNDRVSVASLAVGLALLVLFVANESRVEHPIMPLRLFLDRERIGAYAARFLFLGAMVGFWFFTSQLLQSVMGFSPLEAGLAFMPMTIPNFAVALVVPRLTRRFGNARLLAGGLTVVLVGMAWLSRVSVGADYLTGVALPMILIGIGQGAAFSPLTVSGVARVAPEEAGAASGLVNVAHQLGLSLGLSVLTVVFASAGSGVPDPQESLARGVSAAFTGGTVMLAIALVLAVLLIVRPARAMKRRVDTLAACEQAA